MYIQLKRGETLSINCTDTDGDLSDYTITADAREGYFCYSLTFEAVDMDAGTYKFTAPDDDTKSWPVGTIPFDIKYEYGGESWNTQTVYIVVNDAPTR